MFHCSTTSENRCDIIAIFLKNKSSSHHFRLTLPGIGYWVTKVLFYRYTYFCFLQIHLKLSVFFSKRLNLQFRLYMLRDVFWQISKIESDFKYWLIKTHVWSTIVNSVLTRRYELLPFARCSNMTTRGAEFRHSTNNVSKVLP